MQQSLSQYAEQAYLDYAMYVILDRALPFVGDGLKPVQRRILYAMSELGLKATAKYKKSARTIGDVLGKFHPHGESACYETMVLMAQSFSYRYPLIDGQGNWGSVDDPKSFAAMRYTEARLTPYAQVFLTELSQGATTWLDNFDGTLKEPAMLPAQLPNVLLNGATGIAVGLATDVPPHHMGEIAQACIHVLKNPDCSVKDLRQFVKGPDYPTGGILLSSQKEIDEIYEQGQGQVRLRCVYRQEDSSIIIHQLPHQVPSSRAVKQIADQMRLKKLPGVIDFRDESDQDDPVRLVLVLRSNRVDTDAIMSHLFATTDLERSCRVQMNVIDLARRPKMMSLKQIIASWLSYRKQTVTRRLNHEKEGIEDRLHILEGLMLIGAHIDEVIRIIRHDDHPKQALIERFDISESQADAILEIRLRQLAKVVYIALEKEYEDLKARLAIILELLSSKEAFDRLIIDEIEAVCKDHENPRRTVISQQQTIKAKAMEVAAVDEPLTVVLSKQDWIRAAKSHDFDLAQVTYRPQDGLKTFCYARTAWPLLCVSEGGRAFNIPGAELPSIRSKGEPISKWIKVEKDDHINHIVAAPESAKLMLVSSSGYGFIAEMQDAVVRQRAGKALVKVDQGASVLCPHIMTADDQWLALLTAQGRLMIIPLSDCPKLRQGKGNKLIEIRKVDWQNKQDKLVAVMSFKEGETLKVATEKRYLLLDQQAQTEYRAARAKRGFLLPRGFRAAQQLSVHQTGNVCE